MVGVGRGTEWGRPLATFSAGALAITGAGLPAAVLIAWLLYGSRQPVAPAAVIATA